MPRLTVPAILMTTALLGAAPGALAKEIGAMRICGPDRCAHMKRATAQRFHESGGLEGPWIRAAVGRVAYYRVIVGVDDGSGRSAGRFSMAYAPRPGAVLPLAVSPPAGWARLSDRAATTLARLTRDIAPFPPRRFRASTREGALPPRVYQPSRDAAAGGIPGSLLAVVPVALIVAIGLQRYRRRA